MLPCQRYGSIEVSDTDALTCVTNMNVLEINETRRNAKVHRLVASKAADITQIANNELSAATSIFP